MYCRGFAAAALVALGLGAGTTAARAGDVFRLNLTADQPAQLAVGHGEDDADNVQVARWGAGRGWGWGGRAWAGSRVWWGGRPWWGGSRVWWGGRPWWGGSRVWWAGRPWWGGGSWGWGGGSWGWGGGPVYWGGSPCWYGVSLSGGASPYFALGVGPAGVPFQTPGAMGFEEQVPVPQPMPGDNTYPYDGGPKVPVPMPKVEPAPTRRPPAEAKPRIGEGRVVNLVRDKVKKFTYPAYGEELPMPKPARDRDVAGK